MDTKQRDAAYIAGTYGRFPIEIVSGHGSILTDDTGKDYIDLGSGIGVTSFGCSDPLWVEAVTKQARCFQHTSNLYYTAPCTELAEMLCRKTGMSKVFFSNSGAEANECAIKAARKYAAMHRDPTYSTIVTLQNSFHGRTLTTLAATGQEHYHELYQPLTPGFISIPAENVGALWSVCCGNHVAAILVECIQGEGGVIPLSEEYAKELEEFVREKDVLLIVDEVQTGNGRTGELYSYMHYGLKPDIVSTAKGLSGGLPLGATLLSEKLSSVFQPGDHGSTFGGNPVCCAGALSVLSRIDDALLASVREKGEYLRKTFTDAPGIRSVSGMGLMIGLETEKPASEVVAKCREDGVLCLTAKNRVRLLPALNIPMELLQTAAECILRAADPLRA